MRDFNKNKPFSKPWGNNSSGSRDVRTRRFNGEDSNNGMHDAVCAECGKSCRVPFLPVTGRPVYCSDCFEDRGNGEGKKRPQAPGAFGRPPVVEKRMAAPVSYIKNQVNDTEKLDIISKKLDKILKTLHYMSTKGAKSTDTTQVEVIEEVTEIIESVVTEAVKPEEVVAVKPKRAKAKKIA